MTYRTKPFYDGNVSELAEAMRGRPTGTYVVDDQGRRLVGVTFHGTPGINYTAVLRFDPIENNVTSDGPRWTQDGLFNHATAEREGLFS